MNIVQTKENMVIILSKIIENPKELILNKAKEVMHSEGYSSVSIRRIAKDCNISIGTIYNYFPSKKELIVEMMANFWNECFYDIDIIVKSSNNFYSKLRVIFSNLNRFLQKFKEVWLKTNIYSTPEYIRSGVQRQNVLMGHLINTIEDLLKTNVELKTESLDYNVIANFIIMNFITIIQMPSFKYDQFENILKQLLE